MARPTRTYTNHYPSPTEAMHTYLNAAGIERSLWPSFIAGVLSTLNLRQAEAIHHRVHHWLRWWESAGLAGRIQDPANLRAFLLEQTTRPYLSDAGYGSRELACIKTLLSETPGMKHESVEIVARAQYAKNLEANSKEKRHVGRPLRWSHVLNLTKGVNRDDFEEVTAVAIALLVYDTLCDFDGLIGLWQNDKLIRPDCPATSLALQPDGWGMLTIPSVRGRAVMSNASVRPSTMALVMRHREMRGVSNTPGTPLFSRRNGSTITLSHWTFQMRTVMKRLGLHGIGFGCSAIKGGAALDLIANGASVLEAQAAGRWKTPFPILDLLPKPRRIDLMRQLMEKQNREANLGTAITKSRHKCNGSESGSLFETEYREMA